MADVPLPPAEPPLSRDELVARINASLADNNVQGISAEDVRSRMLELTGSILLSATELGEVSIRQFGAVGDGVTDDRAAVQAAIDSGESLFAPPGIYLIDGSLFITPVNNGLQLRGSGMDGATTFKSADFAHAALIMFSGGTSGNPILDIHLEEFKLDGNKDNMTDGQSGARGIYMSGGGTVQKRFHFRRIWMDKVLDQGFNIGGGVDQNFEQADSLLEYCRASNGGRSTHTSAGGLGGSGFTGGGIQCKLRNCISEDNYLAGFKFSGAMESCVARRCGGGFTTGSVTANTEIGMFYINCIAEYCGNGWYMRGQSDKTILMGCVARYNDMHGIVIGDDTRGVHIGGGTRIYNNGQLSGIVEPADIFGGWNGIFLQAASVGGPVEIVIDDCQIYDNQRVKTQDYGINSTTTPIRCVVGARTIVNDHKIARIRRLSHVQNLRVLGYSGSPVQSNAPFIGNAVTPLVNNPFTTTSGSRVVTVAHTAHGRAVNDYVNIADRSLNPAFVDLPLDPLSTTSGSAVVTLTHTAHGAVVGETVEIRLAAAVGGITVFGRYLVATVPDANHVTFVHSASATSTVTGGGANVNVGYYSIVGGLWINGRFRIQGVPNANSYQIWHEAAASASATGGGSGVTGNYATIADIPYTGNPNVVTRVASFVIPPAHLVKGSKFKVIASGTKTGTVNAANILLGTGTGAGTFGTISAQTVGQAQPWWGEATFVVEQPNSVRSLIIGGEIGGETTTTAISHAISPQTAVLNVLLLVQLTGTAVDTVTLTSFSIAADE